MEHPDGARRAAASGRPASPARDLDLLEEMGSTILDAAAVLAATLDGMRPAGEGWQAIRDLEHPGGIRIVTVRGLGYRLDLPE